MPAQAGIQSLGLLFSSLSWIPAFARMTHLCNIRQKTYL